MIAFRRCGLVVVALAAAAPTRPAFAQTIAAEPAARDPRPPAAPARPRPGTGAAPPPPPVGVSVVLSGSEQDEDYAESVVVRGQGWSSPRGIGDVRVKRELLQASPRLQTSELLSAAPGFFVDHEDGEGVGNDVQLRGFDLEHGAGIEMLVGSVPINVPNHIRGQGYADVNFIIPEVVRSIRVLQGPYDPRQGDAAIVGSAQFDLGVGRRGYQMRSTYGSFGQLRVVGIAAPKEMDEETFVAASARRTDGFGTNRESESGALNAQYAIDLGGRDRARFFAMAYGTRGARPGVVRRDDVAAGRIGFYGQYPHMAEGQSVQSTRLLAGVDLDHVAGSGARFEFAPWVMMTDFRARQNFAGSLESSQVQPSLFGLGDLFETANRETAVGATARVHSAPFTIGKAVEIITEPGVYVRAGRTEQSQSLLVPGTLQRWDRRVDAKFESFDIGSYLDLDVRLWKRLRISGGPRADILSLGVDDALVRSTLPGVTPGGPLAGSRRSALGVAFSPRATAEYEITPQIAPAISYGQGYRSLGVVRLAEGAKPFSKVHSAEAGIRISTPGDRLVTRVAAFETRVENELVFVAESGGLEGQLGSTRRGLTTSLVTKPNDWLLASAALSVTTGRYKTNVAGINHYIRNVPPLLFRTDVTAQHRLGRIDGHDVSGRVGLGYTFMARQHLTDNILTPTANILNAGVAVRYRIAEFALDAYNALDLRYADDEGAYVSNWSFEPGQQAASIGRHVTAAPPMTILATVGLYVD